MRCPYCGGLNRDQSAFCVNCGRDMRENPYRVQNAPTQQSTSNRPPQQPAPPRPSQPQVPVPSGQGRPTAQRPPAQQQQPPANRRQGASSPVVAGPQPVSPPVEPEPPGPFPPTSLSQFEALLNSGAQAYTVVESTFASGNKKIVRITYPACTRWQQAATLLKALREQQENKYATIIIQGNVPHSLESYGFTNGQLQFDRNARLGSRVSNRYVVETDNGYASDAIRFVLNE